MSAEAVNGGTWPRSRRLDARLKSTDVVDKRHHNVECAVHRVDPGEVTVAQAADEVPCGLFRQTTGRRAQLFEDQRGDRRRIAV